MNYHNEINNILRNQEVWGVDTLTLQWRLNNKIFKLDKSMFESAKKHLDHYKKDDLRRMLIVSEDLKRNNASNNLLIPVMIPISITWFGITMKHNLFQNMVLVESIFFSLLVFISIREIVKNGTSDKIHDRAINCIQTAIKELLDE